MKTAIAKAAVAIHPVVIIVAALGAGGCVSDDELPAGGEEEPDGVGSDGDRAGTEGDGVGGFAEGAGAWGEGAGECRDGEGDGDEALFDGGGRGAGPPGLGASFCANAVEAMIKRNRARIGMWEAILTLC
ncbi:hypothetical protein MA16_Dca029022 [Dendrobium catenatum]|uniref:Uncharacterized protein n=1 Tax=Dendrobium catenatum TaxID=906689 RepID=A0A2I0V839_9ASPA|nr:hypothetical protein MA16_Dca029022 [Dendrobium catenatum]